MSRSRILPSFSSSRQMMIAWKVSGLSHRPAIIASRPASMRLAMAISPSRDRSSTEPISRRYMRTGSSVRSAGSELRIATAVERLVSTISPPSASSSSAALRGLLLGFFVVLAVHDVDAHLAEHRVHVLDLVGGNLFGRQHRVQFVLRHPAALLGDLQHPLDGRVAQIEKGAVGGFGGGGFAFGLRLVLLRHRKSPSFRDRRGLLFRRWAARGRPRGPVQYASRRDEARGEPESSLDFGSPLKFVSPVSRVPVRSSTMLVQTVRRSRRSPPARARGRPDGL